VRTILDEPLTSWRYWPRQKKAWCIRCPRWKIRSDNTLIPRARKPIVTISDIGRAFKHSGPRSRLSVAYQRMRLHGSISIGTGELKRLYASKTSPIATIFAPRERHIRDTARWFVTRLFVTDSGRITRAWSGHSRRATTGRRDMISANATQAQTVKRRVL
jgi:hypothetical protein